MGTQMDKGILKDQGGIHMAIKGSSSSSRKKKNNNNLENIKQKQKFQK